MVWTNFGLNVHSVCTNFGLNVHTVCTNFGLNAHTVCTNFGFNVHTQVYKKAPNDLKTLPMGILHDYMSCWSTLGPFRYPRGPQNDPKQHQKGLEWLKITRMAQNVTAWLQMTLNTSNGYITWLYVMLDHPGPFSEAHGGPIMASHQ